MGQLTPQVVCLRANWSSNESADAGLSGSLTTRANESLERDERDARPQAAEQHGVGEREGLTEQEHAHEQGERWSKILTEAYPAERNAVGSFGKQLQGQQREEYGEHKQQQKHGAALGPSE